MRANFFFGLVALLANVVYANTAHSYGLVAGKKQQTTQQAEDTSNGLPNISSRFKPSSRSVAIFADLLVWRAQESGTENWAEVITGGDGSPEICDIRDIKFDWNAGLRVGLSYGMKHDQWDTQFYYTRFHARGNDHVSSVPNSVYSAFVGNFYVDNASGAGVKGLTYQKASIDWTIHFNIFDWELGRAFWISKALSLRPFVGLKGGWIYQSIHTQWHDPTLPPAPPVYQPFEMGRENIKNNFWGVGPSIGINTKWNLLALGNHSLSLLGDLSAAILYGHWTFKDVYKNDIGQEVSVKLPHNNSGASMLRTFLGFGWDLTFCRGEYHFLTQLGYEMQFWLDQLQFYSFDTGRFDNELTLQGGTLELRFDF